MPDAPTADLPRDARRRWRRVARVVQRFPWIAVLMQRVMWLIQPRYTVGVVGVLLDGQGRVLLVEHVFHPKYPWGLPGGWNDRGEDPSETAVREFREETGLRVRAVRPLLIERGRIWGHLDMVYLCALEQGDQAVRLSDELLSWRWAPLDALPPLVAFHAKGIEEAVSRQRSAFSQDREGRLAERASPPGPLSM